MDSFLFWWGIALACFSSYFIYTVLQYLLCASIIKFFLSSIEPLVVASEKIKWAISLIYSETVHENGGFELIVTSHIFKKYVQKKLCPLALFWSCSASSGGEGVKAKQTTAMLVVVQSLQAIPEENRFGSRSRCRVGGSKLIKRVVSFVRRR